MSWAAGIYTFFSTRRFLLFFLVLASLALSAGLTWNLSLEKGLTALLPDSSPIARKSAELLDLAPFAKVMLVQLSADSDRAAALLPEAADSLAENLNRELMEEVDLLPEEMDPAAFMALLPGLCDEECLAGLSRISSEDGLALLSAIKTELAGSGSLTDVFWRADPFKLRNEIFRRMPHQQNMPMPDPLIGRPLSSDGRRLLMIIKPSASMNDTSAAKAIMADLDKNLKQLPEGISAQVVGAHRHTAANAAAIESDLAFTLSLALALILLIYLFLVRSFGALWLFLTPVAAVILATGGLAAVFGQVSGLALGFGAAVLGIAEDYAVHVHFALRRGKSSQEALSHVARPLLMSTILCVSGFGVLLFSSIPAIRQLAFFSALSIAVGYVWAMVVLPHCPGMDKPREAQAEAAKGRPSLKGPLIPLVFLFIAGSAAWIISGLPGTFSIRQLGLASHDILADQAQIEDTWQLDGGRRIFLLEGATRDEAISQAAALEQAMPPGTASSLARLMPETPVQKTNIAAFDSFTNANGLAIKEKLDASGEVLGFAETAFIPFYQWFLQPGKPTDLTSLEKAGLGFLAQSFIMEKDGRHYAAVMATPESGPVPKAFSLTAFELSASGMERTLSQALAGEKILLPACALLSLLILLWSFRNIRLALLSFIPALCGLIAVLLPSLFTGRPPGLAQTAALPLIICLGADYGIVVVSELMEQADFGAPKAIFVSGLSTIAGIGILALASHPVLHDLGKTVFIGLAAAMPASIVLLPRLTGLR